MKTNILNLFDFERINTLLEGFNKTTGFVTAILDLEGNVLSKSGLRNICADFHRVNALTAKRCSISDTKLTNKMAEGEKYHFYKCLNGLVDVAVPLVIHGEHVANIFSGQFFFEEPDRDLFVKQAKKYNFDNEKYMKAFADVPVFSEDHVKPAMDFLLEMTSMIAEMTMQRMEQVQLNEEIQENQLQLKAQNEELHKAKVKAEASEKYLDNILNNMGDPVFVKDDQSRILLVNDSFCRLFDLTREKIIGKTLAENVDPKEQESFLKIDKQILADGMENINVEKLTIRDGQTMTISTRKTRYIDISGRKFLVGSIRNITEQKLAEEALRKNEEKYRLLFDNNPQPMWVYDLETLNFLEVNNVATLKYGYTREEFLKMNLTDIRPAEELEKLINNVRQEFEEYSSSGEWIHKNKNGDIFTVEIISHSINYNNRSAKLVLANDITDRIKAENSVKKTRDLLVTTLETMTDGFVSLDKDWRYTYMNQFAGEIFGRNPEEMIGKHIWTEFPEGVGQPFHKAYEKAINEQCFVQLEEYYPPYNKWFANRIFPSADGLSIFFQDITDRKLAEKALKESEEKFRIMFENSPVGRSIIGFDGTMNVNEAFCEMLGYKKLELKLIKWQELSHPDEIQNNMDIFQSLKDKKSSSARFEKRYLHKNGSIVWADASTFLQRDAHGVPQFFITSVNNITEKKQAEKELQENKEQLIKLNEELEQRILDRTKEFRDLYDQAPCGYHSLNKDGIVLHINETELKMIGYTKEEVINKMKFLDILTPESQEKFRKSFSSFIKEGFIKDSEFDFIRKDKTIIPVLLSATAVYDSENNYLMSRATLIDNTDLKQAKDEILKAKTILESVNNELKTFTYSVSHDLKAPLRGIDGYSKLLSELYGNQLNEEANHFITTIRSSTMQMSQLIDDLLRYSRLERNQLQIKPLKIRSVIESILKMNEDEILANHFKVQDDVPEIKLVADLNGIQIALRNLIENAIKFSKKATNPEILIKFTENQDYWIISVCDNGIGFDMKYSERIFEIFQRLQRAEDYPGTGIGLAMVAKAMQRMNGKIRAESKVGQGSTFYLEISKTNQQYN